MGLLKLSITVENLEYEVDSLHREVHAGPDDGRRLLRLCALYRQLGCALFLGDLDAAEFQEELFKSARCYLWLLERPPGAVDPYYLCRSRGAPLFDALASGRMDLAQRIAALMQAPFAPRMEPEEDFRWFEVLGALLTSPGSAPGLLAGYMIALDGSLSPRRDFAAALIDSDEKEVGEALRSLSAEWVEEAKDRKGSSGPYFPTTEANICVEAVALARLAADRKLKTPSHLRFVRDELLGPSQAEYPEDFVP
jgi:hypothetical protein